MTNSFSSADLREALRFPFQSKQWLNQFLVGSALFFASIFIPFIPLFFAYGYLVRLMRNAINGAPWSMPDWNDWSQLAKDGLRSFGVAAIYLGPGSVVMFGGVFVYFVTIMGSVFITENARANTAAAQLMPLFFLAAITILMLSLFLGWFLLALGALPLPVALAHFAARDQFRAAFDLRLLARIIRADKWGYLLAWVIVMGLVGLIYVVFFLVYSTLILCAFSYVIITPLTFYLMLVAAALFGSFYRESPARQPSIGSDSTPETVPS